MAFFFFFLLLLSLSFSLLRNCQGPSQTDLNTELNENLLEKARGESFESRLRQSVGVRLQSVGTSLRTCAQEQKENTKGKPKKGRMEKKKSTSTSLSGSSSLACRKFASRYD